MPFYRNGQWLGSTSAKDVESGHGPKPKTKADPEPEAVDEPEVDETPETEPTEEAEPEPESKPTPVKRAPAKAAGALKSALDTPKG